MRPNPGWAINVNTCRFALWTQEATQTEGGFSVISPSGNASVLISVFEKNPLCKTNLKNNGYAKARKHEMNNHLKEKS
jgi:hypothetical protein